MANAEMDAKTLGKLSTFAPIGGYFYVYGVTCQWKLNGAGHGSDLLGGWGGDLRGGSAWSPNNTGPAFADDEYVTTLKIQAGTNAEHMAGGFVIETIEFVTNTRSSAFTGKCLHIHLGQGRLRTRKLHENICWTLSRIFWFSK